jgi:glycerophosphoryl diester phosphodiesterase
LRSIRWVLTVLCCGVVGLGCGDDDGDDCVCPAESVINCGHRGTGSNGPDNPYPENTIPSFSQAVIEGVQMIELDIMHSADGELVVIHDDTVNRTTDGAGCVGDQTLAELQSLDAAFGTSLEGTGVVIPTLEEVLAAVDVSVNVEIKIVDDASCPPSDLDRIAQDLVAIIGADAVERDLVVSSFDFDMLVAVQQADASIYLGLLTMLYSDAQVAADQGFDALNVFGGLYGAEEMQIILDAGLEANVWTINDPPTMEELLITGVSIFITDDPDVLEQTRQTVCADYCPGT